MVIGDWQGTAFAMPPDERAMTGAVACFSRRYANPSLGVTVSVLLVGGLPGKISTHTPDLCYKGSGYILNSPAHIEYRYGPDEHRAVFRTALATREGTNPSTLRIIWGWKASKGWMAPEEPRWSFASERVLCKLYVVRETWGKVVVPNGDPCTDFMGVFLPALDRLVFSAPE
jgi:hypothetical protein